MTQRIIGCKLESTYSRFSQSVCIYICTYTDKRIYDSYCQDSVAYSTFLPFYKKKKKRLDILHSKNISFSSPDIDSVYVY